MPLPKIVTDYLTAQEGYNGEMDTGLTEVDGDVTELNRQIQDLKDNPGEADQDTIDRINALSIKGRELADKTKALNERTPPTIPPTT
jgi:hypothetical protein